MSRKKHNLICVNNIKSFHYAFTRGPCHAFRISFNKARAVKLLQIKKLSLKGNREKQDTRMQRESGTSRSFSVFLFGGFYVGFLYNNRNFKCIRKKGESQGVVRGASSSTFLIALLRDSNS